jgi:PAS domain S-box-containing protein
VLLENRVFGETIHLVPGFSVARIYAYDITERKNAEEKLLRAKEEWERTFSSVPDMIAIMDGQHRILRVNEAMARRLGHKAEECAGLACFEAVHGLSQPPDFCPHSRTLKDGRQHVAEVRDERLGGDFLVSTTPLHDEQGQMIGTVHVAHDITERKKAEEALRESERRMAKAQEMAHLGNWELDLVNNRLSWSDEAYRIFGLKAQEFGATYDAFLEAVHPEDRAAVDAAYSGSLREGKDTYEIEHRVVRRSSGEVRIVHEKCEHVRDDTGRIIRSIGMVHDVTEHKEAEEALKKTYDELELRVQERTAELQQAYEKLMVETKEREQLEAQLRQAQKMEALGTMSGGIAHDFNNILAAIIGFTELLEGHTSEGSRDARHLHRIMEAGVRGRELVRQMLTFSRKAEQEKKPLALSSIVKETVKLVRATTPSTIGIRVNASSEALILGDPTQIQQVLMNLCTNAAHAMREKGGSLDIELSDYSASRSNGDPHGIAPGQYVKLTVRDTGIGMSSDIMDKIFDPFFTTKKVGEGTGLGLSVVHGIVKQHEGHIAVESEPGRGSTFTVYFPRITGDLETDALRDDEIPTGSERILFVDDEEALVEMGEDILAELGYEVTSRMSSREALALLKEDASRFDLVITDQTMPEMMGIELASGILTVRADMPIIMCTGFSYVVDADKAKAAGIKAFVMKPLTKREIARTIRRVLDE